MNPDDDMPAPPLAPPAADPLGEEPIDERHAAAVAAWRAQHAARIARDKAARKRLVERYGISINPIAAVPVLINDAAHYREYMHGPDSPYSEGLRQQLAPPDRYPEPDVEDILAALLFVPAARRDLDDAERDLIERARALRVSWQRIGEALGFPAKGARQVAQGRAKRLKAQTPVTS